MSTESKNLCEERTYSEVFRTYSKTLLNYLYYKTGNEALSQDVLQEAFTRLWKNCAKVAFATAKGYVFKIANNLLLNEYEHQKVVLRHQQQAPVKESTQETPEYLLEEKELKEALEKAIAELPEKQRVVFLLSRIDKKTYQEIADMLGISRQAVEKRMYKALDQLRTIIKGIR
ncbi:MAG: RNA polymerase sigma-70 factor [Bacteroidota bacterium]